MDINNQFDQEMLSAYLDDALSASELGQVEQWLAADPTAVAYLDQLRSNRNTLKAMAALPEVGLRSSFAQRILVQALAAAKSSADENLAEEISEGRKVTLPGAVTAPTAKRWWAWGALAATAAAVGWLAVLPMFQAPDRLGLLPDGTNIPDLPPVVSPSDLAGNMPPQDQNPSELPPASGMKPPEKLVDSSPDTQGQRNQPGDFGQIQLVFIGDLLMSQEAWDAGKFDQLLEEYGIRYEKQMVATQAMIEGLVESQMIVGPDATEDSKKTAALIFIDCPGVALSKLMVKLENDGKDFIDFRYNTAFGGGGLGLPSPYDKLLSALQEQTGTSTGRGSARLIVPDRSSKDVGSLLPGFEAVKKSTAKSDLAKAAELVGDNAHEKGNLMPMASGQMLLILRKQ